MTNEGVASLITYNWRLPHDPQAPGRKGVNAVPVEHSSLSPPMHRFTWRGYWWDRSHPFSVKAGSPEIPVEGKPAHKSAVPGALHSPSYWQSKWCFCQGGSKDTASLSHLETVPNGGTDTRADRSEQSPEGSNLCKSEWEVSRPQWPASSQMPASDSLKVCMWDTGLEPS